MDTNYKMITLLLGFKNMLIHKHEQIADMLRVIVAEYKLTGENNFLINTKSTHIETFKFFIPTLTCIVFFV